MTIRKTLLLAFLFVGLVCSILLATLAFVKARSAVRAEIERNIAVEAAGVATSLDKMLFERLQNAAVWSRLDIMQDLQVRDVDKRLSRFLSDLERGYHGAYRRLACVDRRGQIISSSDATQIGTPAERTEPWHAATLSGTPLDVRLEEPASGGDVGVVIAATIPAAFGGEAPGSLRLTLDWSEIDAVLDQAASADGRMLAVLDADGRVIAASDALRRRGLLFSSVLAAWRADAGKVAEHAGTPLVESPVIVGGVHSAGYGQFPGFGWTTLVVQPVDAAFAPVRHMGAIFLGLLAFIVAFTLLIASGVSRALARPIVALTAVARGYLRDRVLQAPASAGNGEIGELTEAFIRMVHDIDRSQQNLVRASKLAVVGEMSSIIAHEVRTPLGILRSSAQMLQREPALSGEGRELVGFIEGETKRLNGLVSAMLDAARPRTPAFAEADLHAVVRRCAAMLGAQADKRGVRVGMAFAARDGVACCDEEQMTQVVLNLLMNALQILPHGGRIDVMTRDEDGRLLIEIADDGPGIDPAERTRVFEAFFFRREGGIGLGLAVVQQIVDAHGGDIEAADSPLGGALFRIRLPRERNFA